MCLVTAGISVVILTLDDATKTTTGDPTFVKLKNPATGKVNSMNAYVLNRLFVAFSRHPYLVWVNIWATRW